MTRSIAARNRHINESSHRLNVHNPDEATSTGAPPPSPPDKTQRDISCFQATKDTAVSEASKHDRQRKLLFGASQQKPKSRSFGAIFGVVDLQLWAYAGSYRSVAGDLAARKRHCPVIDVHPSAL